MRESFGGAFMIKLVLVFIVIYISFMAVAINYAKVFRVKNNVINILEQYQYDGTSGNLAVQKIEEYLPKVPYDETGNTSVINDCNSQSGQLLERGVCIVANANSSGSNKYYKVTVYISIDFPFFDLHFTIPISGETTIISG